MPTVPFFARSFPRTSTNVRNKLFGNNRCCARGKKLYYFYIFALCVPYKWYGRKKQSVSTENRVALPLEAKT